ncbi:MAG: PAS domain S-box protein [Proteobacteria bacterium]|nr:PAS domain S-box protein [Pseudomonadota bacterium]
MVPPTPTGRSDFFERSLDLFCTASFDGRLYDLNPIWERVLGYSDKQLRAMEFRDIVHPEDSEQTVAQIQSLRFGGRSTAMTIRMTASDGSIHWISWNCVTANDGEGFHAVGREVTRARVLYDIARAIPGLTTPEAVAQALVSEARVLLPSQWTSIALFGGTDAEVVAWEVSGPSGGPRARLQLTEAAYGDVSTLREGLVSQHGAMDPCVNWPSFLAGRVAEGMRSSLKLPIAFGEDVLGALHVGSDNEAAFGPEHITDGLEIASQIGVALKQIRLRGAVERSEAEFRSIAANADGMVIVDQHGQVRFANRAAERLLGLRKDAGRVMFGHEMHPGRRSRIPVLSPTGDGIAEMQVTATEWEGEPAYIASLRDITEQRRLEANLRQAQKMAVVGRLAGGVAHDFNNLLTAMMGHVELIRHELGADHPAAKSVLGIADAVDRATRVAQQVLAFSRKQVVAPRSMDLNRQIRRIEPLLRQACGEDVELHTTLRASVPPIHADPVQVEQVLMNLVVNARDAIEGRGTVELDTAMRAADGTEIYVPKGITAGAWVVLGVRDTGFGMGTDTLEQIFEPFFTTKKEGKGLGLGLSTVHDIVRKSGGHLQVQTQVGEGTSFTIWFPPCDEVPQMDESSTEIETLPGGVERILIVDDEEALRSLLVNCLKDAGYDVLVASNGAEGLHVGTRQGPVDLLLTDVRMPEMNGRELDESLRAMQSNLKTIFMSGYSEDILTPTGVLGEGVEFIAKPFRLSALLKKVRGVLDSEGATATL